MSARELQSAQKFPHVPKARLAVGLVLMALVTGVIWGIFDRIDVRAPGGLAGLIAVRTLQALIAISIALAAYVRLTGRLDFGATLAMVCAATVIRFPETAPGKADISIAVKLLWSVVAGALGSVFGALSAPIFHRNALQRAVDADQSAEQQAEEPRSGPPPAY